MKYALIALALVIGMWITAVSDTAGRATGGAIIDQLSGGPRFGVLALLGVVLFAAVWNFGRAIGRYHKSGDPIDVHYVTYTRKDRTDDN